MGISESRKKLENKVRVMPKNYADGMSAFFGQDVGNSIPLKSYAVKITSAMPAKWERNLKNAFGL